jgi:hypothetical protein
MAGRPLPIGRILVLISVIAWVETRAMLRLERLRQLKNPKTPSGIKSATFRLVAWLRKITKTSGRVLFRPDLSRPSHEYGFSALSPCHGPYCGERCLCYAEVCLKLKNIQVHMVITISCTHLCAGWALFHTFSPYFYLNGTVLTRDTKVRSEKGNVCVYWNRQWWKAFVFCYYSYGSVTSEPG